MLRLSLALRGLRNYWRLKKVVKRMQKKAAEHRSIIEHGSEEAKTLASLTPVWDQGKSMVKATRSAKGATLGAGGGGLAVGAIAFVRAWRPGLLPWAADCDPYLAVVLTLLGARMGAWWNTFRADRSKYDG